MEEGWPTAAQLSQECSGEALLQLSTEIAGYNKYKHRLGLSDADIEEIDNDPRNFNSTQSKFHAALLKWKSSGIDLDNPSTSTATYGRLAAVNKDGEAIRSIHKACAKHTSELYTFQFKMLWHHTVEPLLTATPE